MLSTIQYFAFTPLVILACILLFCFPIGSSLFLFLSLMKFAYSFFRSLKVIWFVSHFKKIFFLIWWWNSSKGFYKWQSCVDHRMWFRFRQSFGNYLAQNWIYCVRGVPHSRKARKETEKENFTLSFSFFPFFPSFAPGLFFFILFSLSAQVSWLSWPSDGFF